MNNKIKLLEFDNQYWKKDPEKFLELQELVKNSNKFSILLIAAHKHQNTNKRISLNKLYNWIYSNTQFIVDNFYTITTRVFCIFHNIYSMDQMIHCQTCGKLIKQNVNCLKQGWSKEKYCSIECHNTNKDFILQITKTKILKYGSIWGLKEKREATNLKHHGVRYGNPIKASITRKNFSKKRKLEIEEKRKQTNRLRFNVDYAIQNHEMQCKHAKRYMYNSIQFDSKPEIAFYIWLSDNNIKFEYHPKTRFTFTFNRKQCKYFVDFLLINENKYIEIKGDHFFENHDPSKKMIQPYKRKSQTDENYQLMCDKMEAKHQCMLKNNVQIMTSKDYLKYEKYVEDKYGKGYIEQFRKSK